SGTDSFIYTICDNGSPVACDEATVYITVEGVAGISIIKSASSATTECVNVGDAITYSFTVTNSGDLLINSISIIDDLLGGDITASLTLVGDTNNDGILDPSETWVFTAPDYIITQADVDAGNITNNVTVNGLEPDGTTTVIATDTYVIDANNPNVTLCNESGINLIKTGVFNNDNGNACTEVDETITYSFTVTNSGDIALDNVIITDPLLDNASPQATINFVSGDTDNDNLLDPSESWLYNATYLVTQIDIDAAQVINSATVTATEIASGTTVSAVSETTTDLLEDTTPPDVSNCAVLDQTIECNGANNESIANDWNATNILALENCATDICDDNVSVTSNYSFTNLVSNCGAGGTITVTYNLTDAASNVTTLTATFTIEDTTAPDLSACVTLDATLECSGTDNETLVNDWNTANIAALETCSTDGCNVNTTNVVTSNYDFTNFVSACGSTGTITVIYTITDDCGNTSTTNATLIIEDTNPPSIDNTATENIDIECGATPDGTLEAWLANNAGATSSDNCSDVTWSNDFDSDTDIDCDNGAITVIFTATDECGNTATTTATYAIIDTIPPVLTVPLAVTIECDEDYSPDNTGLGKATDDCAEAEVTFTDAIVETCGNSRIITRTWTATDACGNAVSADQIITIEDSTAPTFTVPADITIECDTDVTDVTLTGDVTDEFDNCSADIEATFTDIVTAGSCPNASIITRTWSLSDECNNTTTRVQTITVEDTTAPIFSVPADVTIECDEEATDLTLTGDVTDEADNCSTGLEAVFTDSITDGDCPNASVITRTWSLTDECDNTTTFVQTITIQDTTAPTFTVPADITLECDQDTTDLALTGDVTDEADNCSTGLEAVFTDTITDGDCPNASVITRTWSLTDECDNTTTFVQTITIQDTTAPTFSVPADMTIECDIDTTDVTLTGDVTDEADNCSTGLEAVFTDSITDGSCPSTFIIARTWSLTDECDNTTTFVQTITVQDTTAPTFTVPADITIECDVDNTDVTLVGDVTDETDNCAVDLEATFTDSIADGACSNEFVITRTWSLSDDCDNTTTFVQTITVQDTTAPAFNETLPQDADAECDAVPAAETLTAIDNCDTEAIEVVFTENILNGLCVGDYIIERTWTATDSCGNVNEHIQLITVQDTTAPTLLSDLETTLTVECDAIPDIPELVFEDSCSNDIDVVFNEDTSAENDFEDYTIIRTWTVTDDCGNQGVFTQNITVEITNAINAFDTRRCILDEAFDLFDLLSGDFDMDGTWSVVSGNATIDGSFFDPTSAEIGVYTFMYTIADGPCPTEREVSVTLDDDCVVLACGEENVVISKTVTDNGDGHNDFFTISGVEECEFVYEVQIFNRWGAEVFKSNNYKNDWNGFSHDSSVGSSGKVPTGTYYYIINLRNSGLAPFAGPIYVATN
ncbi:MAG: gliding motility-associated C-terminal domain-containing protein, partial [Winogradskyella sp.]|uniref:HYR-like domain-containing protein n=1 Tax=Winogradskyella sp. TaxID=1883156 RepID=UPI00385E7594